MITSLISRKHVLFSKRVDLIQGLVQRFELERASSTVLKYMDS